MPVTPHLILAVIGLICAVVSLVPFPYKGELLGVAVILVAVSELVA